MNVHPQVYGMISKMTYAQARRWLRYWGFTHSQQDKLISRSKPLTDKYGHWLDEDQPQSTNERPSSSL